MKKETVVALTGSFEAHAQQTENGVEYWLARDLQHLLGYAEWRNFSTAISRAKTACEVSGHLIADHFVGVTKLVDIGSGSAREIDDIMLTRYACYLVAQNGDPQISRRALARGWRLSARLWDSPQMAQMAADEGCVCAYLRSSAKSAAKKTA
jgi:DNA-damage-inducible protein D